MTYRDRSDAGRQLAAALAARRLRSGPVVVLGIPRGGVPVAAEVARALGAPLDVVVAHRIAVPHQPELAMGAVAEGGVVVVDERMAGAAGVDPEEVGLLARHEEAEIERRVHRYVGERVRPSLAGRTAVVVDDGIATGATARAACTVARAWGASRVVLAVPLGPPAAGAVVGDAADEVVCLQELHPFLAVGQGYADFPPTSDDEVASALGEAAAGVPPAAWRAGPSTATWAPPAATGELSVDCDGTVLAGTLAVPPGAAGTVVLAHASATSRFRAGNRWLAARCHRAGLATVLMDLLDPGEALDSARVFDVPLLAGRLAAAVHQLGDTPAVTAAPVGLFGSGTGSAAALAAAADLPGDVHAVVSRGGRPDLVPPDVLGRVHAPTLLIVGGRDELVAQLNRRAAAHLGGEHRLVVVHGASHLFPEPGALAQVADLAVDWLQAHLPVRAPGGDR